VTVTLQIYHPAYSSSKTQYQQPMQYRHNEHEQYLKSNENNKKVTDYHTFKATQSDEL